MNSQYSLESDHSYLRCVAQHMDQIAPFGDVPKKIASSVRRSMLATRAMYKAVRSAYKIADKMKSVCIAQYRPNDPQVVVIVCRLKATTFSRS